MRERTQHNGLQINRRLFDNRFFKKKTVISSLDFNVMLLIFAKTIFLFAVK